RICLQSVDAEACRPHQDRHARATALHPDRDHGSRRRETVSRQRHRPLDLHHRRQDGAGRTRRQCRPLSLGHAHHGQQGQLLPLTMRARFLSLISLFVVVAIAPAQAAGVRDFTRSVNSAGPAPTAVSPTQASELTLTLTDAEMRPIQNWIRTSGTLDKSGRVLTTFLRSPDAELVQIGQRTRAYTVSMRTRMNLGKVTQITKQPGGALIEATLPGQLADNGSRFLMEIVVERGPFLSIPNVSIIEEGNTHVAYVQKESGHYIPTVIQTGLKGELYTQVTDGLKEGD